MIWIFFFEEMKEMVKKTLYHIIFLVKYNISYRKDETDEYIKKNI